MKRISIIISFIVLLSSCINLKPVDVSTNTYTLDRASTEQFGRAGEGGTLLIMTPTASPGYETRKLIYVEQPYLLQAFARNEWVSPPAQMLLPLLEESLRNTGYFKAIVKQPFSGMSEKRLNVELLSLQQQFLQQPSEIYMEIKADLIDNRSNTIVASKVFKTSIPTTSPTPYSGVIAANEATEKLLEQVAQFAVENSQTS